MIGYRERIQKHAGAAGFFVPDDYQLLLGWIEAYDFQTQTRKLAGRPLLFWHGTEDEKIPYDDVETFCARASRSESDIYLSRRTTFSSWRDHGSGNGLFVEQLGKSTDSL